MCLTASLHRAQRLGSTRAWQSRLVLTVLVALAVTACTPTDVVYGPCDLAKCDDGNPCTNDGCAKTGVCTNVIRTGTCSDGDSCTENDVCVAGVCTGSVLTCDDKVTCTADACDKTKGCVHLSGGATTCDDGNVCTNDACDAKVGCLHSANTAACSDGNACSIGDTCESAACLSGNKKVNCDDANPCTDDMCDTATGTCSHAANNGPCDDGNACTGEDTCSPAGCVGAVDCACAIAAGQKFPAENCDTWTDDDCNGVINDPGICGATVYKFSVPPECGATCYYDELHNVAVNGPAGAGNTAGYDVYATGQLQDGVVGVDDWNANLGKGAAWEWVAWTAPAQTITLQFAKPRTVAFVRLGVNNKKDGAVAQPPEVHVRVSMDGSKWSSDKAFMLADGTMPVLLAGHRSDVKLKLPVQTVVFVEVRFATPGSWTFIDEIAFD